MIQPTDGVMGIGSGGNYAVAAARALLAHSQSGRGGDRASAPGDRRGDRHLHEHNIVVEELACESASAEASRWTPVAS